MIIQIRGTSGSGKSWVMKKFMEGFSWKAEYIDGRRKPVGYWSDNLIVLGHYETPCGGCDTLGSARQIFEYIGGHIISSVNQIVICEGLLLSEDTKWALQAEEELKILYLNTPVEKCIEQIKHRREEAGNMKSLKEDNTRNRVKVIERSRQKLSKLGVLCRLCSAKQAPKLMRMWVDAN